GVVHARHLLDLPGTGLLVEPLHVAALALLDRGVDIDLDEPSDLLPGMRARGPIRRDQRDDWDRPVPREDLGDERHTAGVGLTVLAVEAQVRAEAAPDLVPVQKVREPTLRLQLG